MLFPKTTAINQVHFVHEAICLGPWRAPPQSCGHPEGAAAYKRAVDISAATAHTSSLSPKQHMAPQPSTEPTIKVLLIGPSNSGKTALLRRYVEDIFDTDSATATIGVDFRVKKLVLKGQPHRLLLFEYLFPLPRTKRRADGRAIRF